MVFGTQELRYQIEAITEERDFFQSRYLEQVSIIQDLQNELKKSKREITRLREELMKQTFEASTISDAANEEKKDEDPRQSRSHPIPDSPSGLTCDDEGSADEEEEVDIDENDAIRESASKLLQWANYRQTRSSLGPSEEE